MTSGLVLVAEGQVGDLVQLVGSLGLVRRRWDHSGEPYLVDRWTFTAAGAAADVLPALLETGRAIAGALELPLFLGVSSWRLAAAARRYRQLGAEPIGALFAISTGKRF